MTWFSHVAFNAPGKKTGAERMEVVSEDRRKSLKATAYNQDEPAERGK